MKKPLFIKYVDIDKWKQYKKNRPSACLMSEYDLGYRGLFGIQWGWLLFRWEMFELKLLIKYKWYSKLKWKYKSWRYKSVVKGRTLYLKDRLFFKSKKIGELR